MPKDPVLERIYQARRKISEQYNHDPYKLVEHYMKLEREMKEKFPASCEAGHEIKQGLA